MKDPDKYFLGIAKAVGLGSSCVRAQCGSVIVDKDNRVVSTGFNDTAPGETNCGDGGCRRAFADPKHAIGYEESDCLHAEQNAVALADPNRCKDGTIYIGAFAPCYMCEKIIRAARIKRIVYPENETIVEILL